jgi:transcriptional regulator GlxA family with amidase domain
MTALEGEACPAQRFVVVVFDGASLGIMSFAFGVFVLAAAGLLDGRPATTHWALAGQLAQMYPKVAVRPDELYVDDGDVLTAGGGAAGMDLGLHLLREHCGAAVANRLARYMVVPPHRPGGSARSPGPPR